MILSIAYPVTASPLDPPRDPALKWQVLDSRGALVGWFMAEDDARLVVTLLSNAGCDVCAQCKQRAPLNRMRYRPGILTAPGKRAHEESVFWLCAKCRADKMGETGG